MSKYDTHLINKELQALQSEQGFEILQPTWLKSSKLLFPSNFISFGSANSLIAAVACSASAAAAIGRHRGPHVCSNWGYLKCKANMMSVLCALCALALSFIRSLTLAAGAAGSPFGYVFADVAQAHSCVILYPGKPLGSALSDKVTTPRNKERQQWPISRSSHSLSLSASSALYWLPLIRGGEEGAANKCVMFVQITWGNFRDHSVYKHNMHITLLANNNNQPCLGNEFV
jgi:hypothetical protein